MALGQKKGQGERGKPRQGSYVNETAKGLVGCREGQEVLGHRKRPKGKDKIKDRRVRSGHRKEKRPTKTKSLEETVRE